MDKLILTTEFGGKQYRVEVPLPIDFSWAADKSIDEIAAMVRRAAEKCGAVPNNTGSPKCEQCKHFDLSQGVYTVECHSCKRYYCGDLFTPRAGA